MDVAVTHRLFLYDELKMKNYRKSQAIDVITAYAGKDLDWEN